MIYLFLLLAIAPPSRESILDMHFAMIQEEWVYAHARPVNLDQVLPPDLADLVRDLGCGRWSCRGNAERLLSLECSDRAVKALIWGSHHKDQEIANRCELMLRAYRLCDHCLGTAMCQNGPYRWDRPCAVCYSVWLESKGDDGIWQMRCDSECLACYGLGYLDGRAFR